MEKDDDNQPCAEYAEGTLDAMGLGPAETQMGAQLINSERDMTLWQASKAQWRMLCCASAAFLVGACFGYDAIINGASIAMPAFTLYFGETMPDGKVYLPSL